MRAGGADPHAWRGRLYLARNGANTHTYPFTSWGTAVSNIQDAVNAATNRATVWVEAGTYTVSTSSVTALGTNVVYIDKPLELRSFSGNPADTTIDGGGAHRVLTWHHATSSSDPFVLDGFTIANGFATNRGGGILLTGVAWTSHVQNCVLVGNVVTNTPTREDGGGGIQARLQNDTVILYNTIIYSNHGNDIWLGTGATGLFTYSCFPTNELDAGGGLYTVGPGSFTNEPQFVDFAGQDFHLNRDTSPCINTGTNQTWMSGAVDLDGNTRIDGTFNRVDMGCYEYLYQGSVITIQ